MVLLLCICFLRFRALVIIALQWMETNSMNILLNIIFCFPLKNIIHTIFEQHEGQ